MESKDLQSKKNQSNESRSKEHIELTERYSAHNYAPLDVVIAEGEGVWVKDVDGKRYLDLLSAYSALNFGHKHPRITAAAHRQLDTLTLTSRAFYNDQFGLLCRDLCALTGTEKALVMNSGAEAVETAIKGARRWGYEVKGIPEEAAEILCFSNNFHGRTTTITSFSTSSESRRHFGPFTPGFPVVKYGDLAEVESRIGGRSVAAVLVEPIQGEGGVIIPPAGFLPKLRELCSKHKVLLIADEVQTGLFRCGTLFACEQEGVTADLYTIGKSLGGGILPVSAVLGRSEVMDLFTPGSHGSTFGGNPFACAVAREVIELLKDPELPRQVRELGAWFTEELRKLASPMIGEIRSRGLMIGADIKPEFGVAKQYCKKLKERGVLCKDTRDQTIRFAPPLVITKEELSWGLERIAEVFRSGH